MSATEVAELPPCCNNCPSPVGSRWIASASDTWGWCGVRIVEQDEVRGYLLLAPAADPPEDGPYATTPVSDDVAVVAKVWVDSEFRRVGMGRQLVQGAAALAHRAGVPALEVIGSYGPGTCTVPAVSWLRRTGFEVTRNHPLHPRLRLDLSRTVRWPRFSHAFDRLTHLVRPASPPEPAGRQPRNSDPEPAGAGAGTWHG
ncbi:GNAT family N-acetyltransferase [Propionibacteriaceae bacterium Y2011]